MSLPPNLDARLARLRKIKDECQAGSLSDNDGKSVMIDLFSASAVVAVADALNETNREKLLRLPLKKMVSVALKLTK